MAVDKVFDELGKMSILELVELKNKIEEEWGITAAAPVAVAAPAAAGRESWLPRTRILGAGSQSQSRLGYGRRKSAPTI